MESAEALEGPGEENPQESEIERAADGEASHDDLEAEQNDNTVVGDHAPLEEPLLPQEESSEVLETSPRLPSLAQTTRPSIRYGLSILFLLTHVVFFFGQMIPMWRIFAHQPVPTDIWINTTTYESSWAMKALGYTDKTHMQFSFNDTVVRTYSLKGNVVDLWTVDGVTKRRDIIISKITAVLLVICSGAWPHIKLMVLQFCWWFRPWRLQGRSRCLSIISMLGKWSLVDVFVVVFFMAILNLQWEVDPLAIQNGLIGNIDFAVELMQMEYSPMHFCHDMLGYSCHKPSQWSHKQQCKACVNLVTTAYNHPEWCQTRGREIVEGLSVSTDGGGRMELSIQALYGLYVFCFAVVLSISCSLIVDIFDRRERKNHRLAAERSGQPPRWWITASQSSDMLEDNDILSHMGGSMATYRRGCFSTRTWKSWGPTVAVVLSTILTIFLPLVVTSGDSAFTTIMEKFAGWTVSRKFSLWGLLQESSSAQGKDGVFLGLTLAIFLLLGPMVRASTLLLASMCPSNATDATRLIHDSIISVCDMVGAICAWEVLLIAIFEVYLLIPAVTNNVLWDYHCELITGDPACFVMHAHVLAPAAFCLLISLCVGSLQVNRFVTESERRTDVYYYGLPQRTARYTTRSESDAIRLVAEG